MKKIWGLVGIFLFLGISFLYLHPKEKSEACYVQIQRKDIVASLVERGRILSTNDITITAKSEGRILSIPIQEGEWVYPGRVLIQMDMDIIQHNLKDAQNRLEAKHLELAQKNEQEKNNIELFEAGSLSKFDLDHSKKQRLLAELDYKSAKSSVELAKINQQNTMYVATEKMQVAQIFCQKGSAITLGTPLVRLIDPYHLKVDLYIKEFDSRFVKLGQKAYINLPQERGFKICSKVSSIQPILEKIGDAYFMKTTVDCVVSKNLAIKPGTQVEVEIITGESKRTQALPVNALQIENGNYFVWVKSPQGKIKRQLRIGLQNSTYVEVQSGLLPGEKVLVE